MAFRRLLLAALLVACGVAMQAAWQHGVWASLTGALLIAIWSALLAMRPVAADPMPSRAVGGDDEGADAAANRLLLDAAPTPMLAIDARGARALNRAARQLFATDDRIAAPPAGLADPAANRLRHEGRTWRIDRVTLTVPTGATRTIAALIDVEQEERVAEARATAEMMHVLGHELLNGLAPIVSLADSGVAALDRPMVDLALLREIVGTLARRADGLHRFTEAYRALARLPEPALRPVAPDAMAIDLARLFAGRWPDVALHVDATGVPPWPLDRDQISQAVWALLQNGAEAAKSAGGAGAAVSLHIAAGADGLSIVVTDSGAGVAPDAVGRIFRPFHTTKPDGSGIGLSLARQIAHAHGGTLTLVTPSPARFRLLLPPR